MYIVCMYIHMRRNVCVHSSSRIQKKICFTNGRLFLCACNFFSSLTDVLTTILPPSREYFKRDFYRSPRVMDDTVQL